MIDKIIIQPDNWQINMHQGVTPISKAIYNLHMIALIICTIIGLFIFAIMTYILIKHRKHNNHKASNFYKNTLLEIIWIIIPFIILIILAIPATKTLKYMKNTNDNPYITIKITGYQWKWQYEYLNKGINFFSSLSTPYNQIHNEKKKDIWYLLEVNKPLILPINKKIRFLITSNDVIHSWWIPELGIKQDAIPGYINETWTIIKHIGIYRGQCAELCGINHSYMPIVIKAINLLDFQKWINKNKSLNEKNKNYKNKKNLKKFIKLTHITLMKIGKEKYEQTCSPCHQINGKGLPPIYPALKNSSITTGRPISRHINIILYGIPGTAMQSFKDQLTSSEIAAIVTYERNAWGNNTNEDIQEQDIEIIKNNNKH
ncbi:cytochrome c oxidase subunit II [Candidatus Legionella polyplacis]|uniref:cytochrome c oxidase subunit II n=1 Tax=Candidatus Legionella polyplacis TaxID=2005262 RepID=UPI0018F1AE6F|nr:cytochrome c oxidase subunit II [Candidatus Legionella polyplacis]